MGECARAALWSVIGFCALVVLSAVAWPGYGVVPRWFEALMLVCAASGVANSWVSGWFHRLHRAEAARLPYLPPVQVHTFYHGQVPTPTVRPTVVVHVPSAGMVTSAEALAGIGHLAAAMEVALRQRAAMGTPVHVADQERPVMWLDDEAVLPLRVTVKPLPEEPHWGATR